MKSAIRRVLNRVGYDIVRRQHANADLADHLRNVLDRRRIDCVLDVGANVGQYGAMLRALGYAGHIVSFEPVRSAFDQLARRAEGDGKWRCLPIALGSIAERKAINIFADTVFSSFHEASDYSTGVWTALAERHREEVEVARLDDLFADIRAASGATRFYLKLDTQGHDIEAFRGAAASLDWIPAMQSELSLIPVYDGTLPPYETLREFTRRDTSSAACTR